MSRTAVDNKQFAAEKMCFLSYNSAFSPRCVNVTRQDCVTKWVVTATGEKVWDGNELCTPVQWQNCTLHEEPKEFNQTYTK